MGEVAMRRRVVARVRLGTTAQPLLDAVKLAVEALNSHNPVEDSEESMLLTNRALAALSKCVPEIEQLRKGATMKDSAMRALIQSARTQALQDVVAVFEGFRRSGNRHEFDIADIMSAKPRL